MWARQVTEASNSKPSSANHCSKPIPGILHASQDDSKQRVPPLAAVRTAAAMDRTAVIGRPPSVKMPWLVAYRERCWTMGLLTQVAAALSQVADRRPSLADVDSCRIAADDGRCAKECLPPADAGSPTSIGIEMGATTYARFDGIQEEIKKLLDKADDSVRICVAWLSLDIYRPIFIRLISRGIKVHLIVNHDDKNDIDELKAVSGLIFTPLMMRVRSKLMHNKFCIIDDRIVITGSYNWSSNAEEHFENIVVIRNDFSLVKQFRHEFEDLSQYHDHEVRFHKCHCKSTLVTLAIFGYEQGKYSESTVGLWSICTKNSHVSFIGRRDEQFLHAQLGMTDREDDAEIDLNTSDATVWDMRSAFEAERLAARRIQSYFESRCGSEIHGAGWVTCTNANEYYKGYANHPEYKVIISMRNAYFRKVIPVELDNCSGEVEKIIELHKPVI